MFALVILGFLIIGLIEIIPMIKRKEKKELLVYMIFFTGAFVLSLLLSLGVEIPSPAKPIERVIESIIGKQG